MAPFIGATISTKTIKTPNVCKLDFLNA